MMKVGLLHLFSLLYLSLVVAFVFGLNDHDRPRDVVKTTLRRWLKMIGALIVIGLIVLILSSI